MSDNLPICPKCGRKMIEVESDPIFKKKEYICTFCKMMDLADLKKREYLYKLTDKIILEEIQKYYDPKYNLKENYNIFKKLSKIKLTFEKYEKIVKNEAQKLKEKISKRNIKRKKTKIKK